MAIRHYVLLATDGFIDVPNDAELCTTDRSSIYVFSFLGGLYQVIENDKIKYENPKLDWNNPDNWDYLFNQKGKGTIPSPMIWGELGDRIYITLINLGMLVREDLLDFHTVHIHGGHVATQLDGFPETSFGVPMWMDPQEAPPVATYYFEPEDAGTYMYHCHIEASEHVQMGMYGGLIIYPSKKSLREAGITQSSNGKWYFKGKLQKQIPRTATNRNFAYDDINSYFDKEYVMLLSDIDSVWHEAVQTDDPNFNAVNFKPDYWLVNGRAFPDTLLPHPLTPPPNANENLTQINYESYVHVVTDDKFLLRMINLGYQVVPWHIHGWHFTVIGKDAHPSPFLKINTKINELEGKCNITKLDLDMQNRGFTVTIGSGETYDLLLTADNKLPQYGRYIFKGQDGLPSLCRQMKKLQKIDPETIFDIPTEPVNCDDPNTVNYVDLCRKRNKLNRFFPQFYPMHNHDDYKVTNNGVYPGGHLTFIQTDKPEKIDPCQESFELDESPGLEEALKLEEALSLEDQE